MAKSEKSGKTRKDILERRRAKKAKQATALVDRKRQDAVRASS